MNEPPASYPATPPPQAPHDEPEIWVYPHRAATRASIAAVLFMLVFAVVFLIWGQPALSAWMNNPALSADQRALRTAWFVGSIVTLMTVVGLGLAAGLGWLAWRIEKSLVYPPQGYPVLAKTRQVRGNAAHRQALQHAAGGLLCLLLGGGVLAALFTIYPLRETLSLFFP